MWTYEKRLQYPVNIKKTCPKTASLIISQFGGPDGELAASMRYLSQRYTMPCKEAAGLLTDIGTEELAHLEIICAMVFLIRVIDDPDVLDPLRFLRAREVVHFQRFGEALEKIKDTLDRRNFYYFNPEFDKQVAAGKK